MRPYHIQIRSRKAIRKITSVRNSSLGASRLPGRYESSMTALLSVVVSCRCPVGNVVVGHIRSRTVRRSAISSSASCQSQSSVAPLRCRASFLLRGRSCFFSVLVVLAGRLSPSVVAPSVRSQCFFSVLAVSAGRLAASISNVVCLKAAMGAPF